LGVAAVGVAAAVKEVGAAGNLKAITLGTKTENAATVEAGKP
jgi:hypothetical protein